MADDDIEKKLDEGLALLRVLRPPRRRIAAVLDGGGQRLLRPEEVVYFTIHDDPKDRRLLIFTADGGQHYNFKGLVDMATLLADDPRFVRVHKSLLVNMEHVTSIRPGGGGRELSFDAPPGLLLKATFVKAVEDYFGV